MFAETLFKSLILLPCGLFLLISLVWLLHGHLSEKATARFHGTTHTVMLLITIGLGRELWLTSDHVIHADFGEWFRVGDYHFRLAFILDRLSYPFVVLVSVLTGLVGSFSVRYLHRDPGFQRFFLLLRLFTFGSLVVFTADSLDSLVAGWELVGITSVLLIGFFQYRREPIKNALRVFATYRIADLNILIAVFLAHHQFHGSAWNELFTGSWPYQLPVPTGGMAGAIAVLLVLAACGKSAQGPFLGWLARAMEGPTPSSAIFYGAISVHAGAYLLLRVEPLIRASSAATIALIAVGLITAVVSTLIHRTSPDAKTSLAYACQTQLGIIFVEIGLGFTNLALIHVVGHAVVRTMQFLRTPSMLSDHHRVHAASGGNFGTTGGQYESLLPRSIHFALYRIAFGRVFYDVVVDRFLIAGTRGISSGLARLEPKWARPDSTPSIPSIPTSATGRHGQH
jgi:NAD(P)H-quinone oxidoreductase subunit 5